MKKTITFVLILLFIIILGIMWGIYDYQTEKGLTTYQTVNTIKDFIGSYYQKSKFIFFNAFGANKAPENKMISKTQDKVITPLMTAPITPTEPPPITFQELVDEGNRFYDEGVKHLENTFEKDDTFDKENDLAMQGFRDALNKYTDAQKINSKSQWLMNRIRNTNMNLVTCRKQARRK